MREVRVCALPQSFNVDFTHLCQGIHLEIKYIIIILYSVVRDMREAAFCSAVVNHGSIHGAGCDESLRCYRLQVLCVGMIRRIIQLGILTILEHKPDEFDAPRTGFLRFGSVWVVRHLRSATAKVAKSFPAALLVRS